MESEEFLDELNPFEHVFCFFSYDAHTINISFSNIDVSFT